MDRRNPARSARDLLTRADLFPIASAVLDSVKKGAGERLGVGERHHVAGAVDQRVLRVRHVSPDDLAERVVDDGGVRSLDDVDRCGHRGQRVNCEQAVVEENVP